MSEDNAERRATTASVQRGVREAKTAPPGTCTSTCSAGSASQSRVARSTVSKSSRARSARRPGAGGIRLAGAHEHTCRVEQDGGPGVRRELAEAVPGPRGSQRPCHPGQNTGVPLSRISWLVTLAICLVAALLLLINGYVGYSGVLLAVGAAAAVNLL